MVSTTPPAANDSTALDGFASLDASTGTASVLFGGVNDGTLGIVVKGFEAAGVFGARVHAVVERTPWVNRTTAVTATATVSSADVTIANDQLSVTVATTNATDGYRLTLTALGLGMAGMAGAAAAGAGGRGTSGAGAGGNAGAPGAAGASGGGGNGGMPASGGRTSAGAGGVFSGGAGRGASSGASDGGTTGSAGGAVQSAAGGVAAGSGGMTGTGGVSLGASGSGGVDRAANPAASRKNTASSGCSCSVERSAAPPWFAAFGLVAVALAGRRRASLTTRASIRPAR
jgi:MYXO-CTERM domain-containing protein